MWAKRGPWMLVLSGRFQVHEQDCQLHPGRQTCRFAFPLLSHPHRAQLTAWSPWLLLGKTEGRRRKG